MDQYQKWLEGFMGDGQRLADRMNAYFAKEAKYETMTDDDLKNLTDEERAEYLTRHEQFQKVKEEYKFLTEGFKNLPRKNN